MNYVYFLDPEVEMPDLLNFGHWFTKPSRIGLQKIRFYFNYFQICSKPDEKGKVYSKLN